MPLFFRMVLKAGSLATEVCEPRQVRKEATVSRALRVPGVYLAGAVSGDMLKGLCRRGVHGLYSCLAANPSKLLNAGEYFVMGDNRARSNGLRQSGPVPPYNIVGRVAVVDSRSGSDN